VPSLHGSRLAGAALLIGAMLAACGGAPATPTAAPATPAPATPAPATAAPTPEPTATPTPAPFEFTSDGYGYRITLPGGATAEQRLQPWDGEATIQSDGQYTDRAYLPGNVLFFVYGAPTDLALDEYVARTQAQVVDWHDCPTVPGSATDLPLDGTTGRLHRMTCLGTYVQKLMLVRDGEGLVVNMLAPPNVVDEASTLFEELVAAMTWPA